MITYGFSKEIDMEFGKAVDMVVDELKKEGFGVLTRIDVKAKLKEKLGIDFCRYEILGACHPASAHEAILVEENIGLMLPCNVIVYEKGNRTVISMIKPMVAMEMIDNGKLKEVARNVQEKLERVFNSIQ